MSNMSRRSFLAASAVAAANPSLAAPGVLVADTDIAIVGAGAAGIAAARRVQAAGRRCVLLEASDRLGGRCFTDTASFGVPVDRGAHWIHMPDINPVTRLAGPAGFDVYPAPPGQRMRIGPRYAREGEMEDFLAAVVRANRAIGEAVRSGKADVSCAQALPKDLLDWRATVEFVLGPWGCAKDLADVSAMDFARSAERDIDSFCRQGFGALIAKLGAAVPVQLASAVSRIDLNARGVDIETARGHVSARGVIVTVSTGVLAAAKIKFVPDLSKRQLDAVGNLKLGSYDRVMLELKGNPLGLERDELVYEKADGIRTAGMLANVAGTPVAMIDVGGKFGRDLAAKGTAGMVAFATEWLAGLYGADVKKAVGRTSATQWNDEPWVLGAFSAAAPGGQPARRILMEPVRDRMWLAGEAVHETLWGTVGGAWESGERAAEAALKKLGLVTEPREARPRR
jgi:monoamine oxidase